MSQNTQTDEETSRGGCAVGWARRDEIRVGELVHHLNNLWIEVTEREMVVADPPFVKGGVRLVGIDANGQPHETTGPGASYVVVRSQS